MRRNLFLGVVLITLGTLFLLNNFGVADFGDMIHDYWPLILILWGLSIVLRNKVPEGQPVATEAQTVNRDLLHESNVFGSFFLKNSSQNFLGGSVSTVFGDCDLDLSDAAIAEGEHVLRFHSVFGDSTIMLPKEAAVSVTANSTFGSLMILGQRKEGISSDIHAATPGYETAPRRLQINVSKVFGSIRIS